LYNINADLPPGIDPCNMREPTVFEEDMDRGKIRYIQTQFWKRIKWIGNEIVNCIYM
jgi:hypothetical protein